MMKNRFWITLALIAALLGLSACDVLDLGSGLDPAVGPEQPAVSVAQRQISVLTPAGQQSEPDAGTGEGQITETAETLTASGSQETNGEEQGENQTNTVSPTTNPSESPAGDNATQAPTATPNPTNTTGPGAATNPPQPTNTTAPPTATFTSTTAPQPEPTFTFTPIPPTEEPGGGGTPSCNPGGNSSFEAEVVNLINQERATEGLPALSNQSQLTSAARTHSDDMACNNFFSHTSPTTGSPFDRIAAAGYSYSAAGENIAAGYGSPSAVVDGWMDSSGHRANILNPSFTQIGVGYAYWEDSDYDRYWTAVFASP